MKHWKRILMVMTCSTVLWMAPDSALVADDPQPEPGTQQPQKLERTIKLNLSQDSTIISGILLRFGSLTLNGSLRHMLQEKGNNLKEQLDKGLLKRTPKA